MLDPLPAAAASAGQLQVVAINVNPPAYSENLWHTIRSADGSWVPQFGNINSQESNGGSLLFSICAIA